MIRSEKKLKQLAAVLERKDNLLISEAVRLLRDEQPFEGAIGLLTSLYDRSDDISVRKAVGEFMNDIKDQTAVNEVISEIGKEWKPQTLSMLAASCWQSGLDYSSHVTDLARIFAKCDFATAVECFTVIEESADQLTPATKSEIKAIIADASAYASDEKRKLTIELVKVLGL
jgi:hypothetical protein